MRILLTTRPVDRLPSLSTVASLKSTFAGADPPEIFCCKTNAKFTHREIFDEWNFLPCFATVGGLCNPTLIFGFVWIVVLNAGVT